jgi:transposase
MLPEAAGEGGAPRSLCELPAIEALRWIWVQKYFRDRGGLRWRDEADGLPPSALLITPPHDVEPRFGKERSTTWIGYKIHLTETCDDDAPHPIVNATTAPAPAGRATPEIHGSLPDRELLSGKQMVDAGCIAFDLPLRSVHQLPNLLTVLQSANRGRLPLQR